jgi:predicted RNA methylase
MEKLKTLLEANDSLRHRLFQVEFLSTENGDTLLSLIYHKKLDEHWREAALQLQQKLAVQVIGRSRKHKVVLGRDYVTEELKIAGRKYSYRQAEGVFTQPNAGVNRRMIEWALEQTDGFGGDLLELYCGIGNFTLPLATRFRQVLATEISKHAVTCARANMAANGIDNITLLRMSSEDFTAAMDGVRPFRRLRDVEIVPAFTMRQNDLDLLVKLFAAPMQMMVAIAFSVGTAILGMVVYTATVERMREYGVLKAVGAKNRHLYWLVTQQALVVALVGVTLGIGGAWLAAWGIMEAFPRFLVVLRPGMVLPTALTGVAMGLLAALLPARYVARLDPARVFRK